MVPPSQVENDSKDEQMQDANDGQNKSSSAPASVATHTRPIGIIHPPPDIRTIADKAASFVAKTGPEFEKIIIANNARNPKFYFLKGSDSYHAYYQHRLTEFRAQNQASGQQANQASLADSNEKVDQSKFSAVKKVLDPPEAEQYAIRLPEGITSEELDIIQLTAQFVARNGKSFLTGLTSRENNNPQFHFLKPTKSIFMLFTSLADAYSKVLMPPKCLTDKLKESLTDMTTVLERCLQRLEWERSQEQARQKAEDEIEEERLLMSMIDWHDFAVAETIDFADDEDDDLPPPMTLEEEVQLVQEAMKGAESYEVETVEEENEPQMRIVKNYKRPEERLAERNPGDMVVSLITGELIAVNEMSEHMRISLIDPKYKEQKERMFAKIRETTLAQDDEISRNIVGLARTRPDIFGTTEEEVSNAVKAEIEKKNLDQIDDGRNLPGPAALPPRPSLRPLPPPPGLALNLPRVPPNAQYSTPPQPGINMMMVNPMRPPVQMDYGQQQPYMMQLPSIPVPRPPGSQFTPRPCMPMVPPPPEEAPPPLPEEPERKKQRLDDSLLVPEDEFLAQHPGPVCISVSVPNTNEGNLKGQILEITIESLSESVSSLKEKIAGEIQLPANKQKLSGKAGFFKDNLSLAYYNVAGGQMLSLSLRERGGRKR